MANCVSMDRLHITVDDKVHCQSMEADPSMVLACADCDAKAKLEEPEEMSVEKKLMLNEMGCSFIFTSWHFFIINHLGVCTSEDISGIGMASVDSYSKRGFSMIICLFCGYRFRASTAGAATTSRYSLI